MMPPRDSRVSRHRFPVPAAALVVVLVIAGSLVGCGEGERIPVVPGLTTLDMPPDPFFVTLAPRCGTRIQNDAVWLDDGRAFIVGTSGLVLAWSENGPWYPDPSGTNEDLLAVASLSDGRVIAIGRHGTIIERVDGFWSDRSPGTDHTLREIVVSGDQTWAVGEGGTVVHRSATGVWELVDCPTEMDLTGVAAQEDTLYVCGQGGLLLSRHDGVWVDESGGPWGVEDVLSVGALPDGPVVALADSLYVRRDGAWRIQPVQQWFGDLLGMKADYGSFWLEGSTQVRRFSPLGEVWPLQSYYVRGNPAHIAPEDSSRALIISGKGGIRWYETDGEWWEDPSGLPGNTLMFRLADGARGCMNQAGILAPGPTGLITVEGYSSEVLRWAQSPEFCEGRSFQDFYLANSRDLYRVLDGELHKEMELPDWWRCNSMAMDQEGNLHFGYKGLIYRWNGSELTQTLADPEDWADFQVRTGQAGTLLAWTTDNAWYYGEGEWICLGEEDFIFAGESSAGEIRLISRGSSISNSEPDMLHVWRRDAGLLVSREIELVPGVEELRIKGVTEDSSGLYVFTYEPARVFRLAGDPLKERWELVAGPYDGWIDQLLVLDDGSLLVFDNRKDHISLRRFH